MLYTVYKTTNLVNGKYYFGVHRTEDPCDSYLGSGKVILKAIIKYGKQSFKKDVLFIYPTADQAFSKEKELVSAFKGDPSCYNIRDGGAGEFKRTPTSEETRAKLRAAGNGKYKRTPEIKTKHSIAAKKRIGEKNGFFGRRHTEKTLQKMRHARRNRGIKCQ